MEQFVDRNVELDQLTDCYESETADFIVLYGRYLGKSELVRQSIGDRDDAVYRWDRPGASVLDPEAVHCSLHPSCSRAS